MRSITPWGALDFRDLLAASTERVGLETNFRRFEAVSVCGEIHLDHHRRAQQHLGHLDPNTQLQTHIHWVSNLSFQVCHIEVSSWYVTNVHKVRLPQNS